MANTDKMVKQILTALLVVAAVILSACSNMTAAVEQNEVPADGKSYLSVTLGSSRAALLPTGFTLASDKTLSYELNGTVSGGTEKTIKTWTAEGSTPAYGTMIADTTVYVDSGLWSFTLNVTKDSAVIMTGTVTATIKPGTNELDFGTLVEPADGTGSFSVTFTYPHVDADGVSKVTAGLYALDGTEKIAAA